MDAAALSLLEEGIKEGFLTLDVKLRERHETDEDNERSGTTAICAIVTPSHIVLANLGIHSIADHFMSFSQNKKYILSAE